MISEYQMHAAACEAGFILQPHEQVHDKTRIRATIKQITCRDEVRPAAAPGQAVVDDAGCLKRRRQGIVGTVDITDSDNSFGTRKMPLVCLRKRSRCLQTKQQRSKK